MMKHNVVLMTLHAMKHGDSSEDMGLGIELLKFIEEDECSLPCCPVARRPTLMRRVT